MVPGNFEGRLGLALLNQKDHHYTEALDNINILVSQYPDSAVAYAARGGMEAERNMLDLAEYDFGKAIELAPDNTEYRLNRVDVRLRMKRKDEAREDLDEMVKGECRVQIWRIGMQNADDANGRSSLLSASP